MDREGTKNPIAAGESASRGTFDIDASQSPNALEAQTAFKATDIQNNDCTLYIIGLLIVIAVCLAITILIAANVL